MNVLPILKQSRQAALPGIVFLMLIFASAGCSTTHSSAGKTLDTEHLKLTYTDKAQMGAEIGKMTLQHPLPVTEQQMIHHMTSLKYENFSLLGEKGTVFTRDDINNCKRLLVKALNHVNPQNIIAFEVESEDGTTEGEVFASGGNLHWRFSKIRGIKYSLTRNQMARYGTAWRLVPGKDQKYYVTEQFLGAKQWDNWIVAQVDLAAPSNLKRYRSKPKGQPPAAAPAPPAAAPAPQSTAPRKDPAELEEKLKFLKHLHENQLIDRQEYEQKRKDLLDQYL